MNHDCEIGVYESEAIKEFIGVCNLDCENGM